PEVAGVTEGDVRPAQRGLLQQQGRLVRLGPAGAGGEKEGRETQEVSHGCGLRRLRTVKQRRQLGRGWTAPQDSWDDCRQSWYSEWRLWFPPSARPLRRHLPGTGVLASGGCSRRRFDGPRQAVPGEVARLPFLGVELHAHGC